ncbi:MAG TPA: hypothetical protein PLA88_11030, partial [Bacteroidales bacterium]|nr:hypothetical protein [Bacteroidales bacterium]
KTILHWTIFKKGFEMNKNHIVENIISKYERIKCGYFYALMQKSIYFVLANGCSEILPIFEVRKCLRDNSSKYLWVKCGIIKEDYQPK